MNDLRYSLHRRAGEKYEKKLFAAKIYELPFKRTMEEDGEGGNAAEGFD